MVKADRVPTMLRLPRALHERIWKAAAAEDLSVNQWATRELTKAIGTPAAATPASGGVCEPVAPRTISAPAPAKSDGKQVTPNWKSRDK